MFNRISCAIICLLSLCLTACRNEKLPVINLKVGNTSIKVEVARTPLERERGLMYRTALGADEGMIFVYESDIRMSFWMRNTHIPLSIAFISAEGEITQIEDMQALDETTVDSRRSVRYALEVNQGAFARWGVRAGDKVVFPQNFPE